MTPLEENRFNEIVFERDKLKIALTASEAERDKLKDLVERLHSLIRRVAKAEIGQAIKEAKG